jgi:hypothetical protein
MSSHPNSVRSWGNAEVTADPHPTAANSNRPVARHPDVLGTRSHWDYLRLCWRRGLLRDHRPCRSPRLRWHINDLAFNTTDPQDGNSTQHKYQ